MARTEDREQRLAAALRENLRKRKAQGRASAETEDTTPANPAADASTKSDSQP